MQDGVVTNSINKIADMITRFVERTEHISGKKPEHIAFVLYLVGHLVMMFFHEPWFDEAAAWLIAKDSSIYELLFTVPHYEGHPSLWHLILLPFAKMGASHELTLGIVSMIFSGTAMALFIYKAPFKRTIRLLMPFSFFFFYQYGVVSRPYCMMMLGFFLMAFTYGKRNEHPGRFVMSMMFLCMTSAYGIVIAGGVCIAWLIEMIMLARKTACNKNSDNGEYRCTIKIFIEDHLCEKKKIIWFFLILTYAIFLIIRIIPYEDTYAVLNSDNPDTMSFGMRLLFTAFGLLSDLFITNTYYYGVTLSVSHIGILEMIPAVLIGAGILAGLIILARRKKMLSLFMIPYVMLVICMSYLYMSRHHMGISLMFIVFFLWVSIDKKCESVFVEKTKEKSFNARLVSSLLTIILSVGVIIPIYWGISSTIIDVFSDYSFGKAEYKYLEEKGLLGSTILAEWSDMPKIKEDDADAITFSGTTTVLLAYMDRDVFLNSPAKAGYDYSEIHKIPDTEATEELIESIRKQPVPDIIIGEPDVSQIYTSGNFSILDYECVLELSGGIIWKGIPGMTTEKVYVRMKK